MELIFKISIAALNAVLIGLLLRKRSPELSTVLSMCAVCMILLSALGFAAGLKELTETVRKIVGDSETLIAPVLKCVGIALISRVSAELCRDASQSAAAAAVEWAGSACAMGVAMPLILGMLKMLGALL